MVESLENASELRQDQTDYRRIMHAVQERFQVEKHDFYPKNPESIQQTLANDKIILNSPL